MKKAPLLLCLLLALGFLFAQEKQANYARVKIHASTHEHFITLLQKGVCLDNLEIKKGVYIIGEFSDWELERIIETEIPFEVLIENMSDHYVKQNIEHSIEKLNEEMRKNPKIFNGNRTPAHFHLGSMGGYFTLAEIMTELDEMRTEFPHLISAKTAFPEQTVQGRSIYWVRISNNPDIDQEKPRVLYTSLTHAREPAGMQQMIYQMWDLLEKYDVDPEITYYIDNLELYFVPCVNPDGYERNRSTNPNGGGMWRKNRKQNSIISYGIDLNRNWGYQWGYDNTGSSPNGSSETYRGTAPFSEVETQVLRDFCESTEISLCLSNHTYSNLLVYPYGYINSYPPEHSIYVAYAQRLTSENGYAFGNCFELLDYYSNGSSDDWLHGEQTTKNMVFAFTPEAGDPAEGFWPPSHRIEAICAGHVTMNKYLMRFALPFVEIEDKTETAFQSLNCTFKFELLSLGLPQNVIFSVSMEPISNNILSVQTTPLIFENLNVLDKVEGELSLVLKPNTRSYDEVVFDICIDNGSFTQKYRFTKLFEIGLLPTLFLPDTIAFFDVDLFYELNMSDYVTNPVQEEFTVSWEGNEHLLITYNETTQHLHIASEDWTGCENVTFFVGNSYGEVSQDVVIQCILTNSIPIHSKNSFIAFYNANTKKIIINGTERATSFVLFNVEGKLLENFEVNNKSYEINVAKFQSGIYFLKTNFGEVQKVAIY